MVTIAQDTLKKYQSLPFGTIAKQNRTTEVKRLRKNYKLTAYRKLRRANNLTFTWVNLDTFTHLCVSKDVGDVNGVQSRDFASSTSAAKIKKMVNSSLGSRREVVILEKAIVPERRVVTRSMSDEKRNKPADIRSVSRWLDYLPDWRFTRLTPALDYTFGD